MLKSIIKFISESRTELVKVTWPTREQAVNLTLTVLGVSLLFALYIAGVDYLLTEGVKWISERGADNTVQAPPVTPDFNLDDIINVTPQSGDTN